VIIKERLRETPMTDNTVTPPGGRVKPRCAPFAALPHFVVEHPDLSSTAKTVCAALLFWARGKAVCWPSDKTIAARVKKHPGTVQRALASLERAGVISRERASSRPDWRVIRLRWRSDVGAPALNEGKSVRKEKHVTVTANANDSLSPRTEDAPEGSREPSVSPKAVVTVRERPQPLPPPLPCWATKDAIGWLPGRPEGIPAVAHRLAEQLGDDASLPYYAKCCAEVVHGVSHPDRLASALAYGLARRAAGATRPGAAFAERWKHWRPCAPSQVCHHAISGPNPGREAETRALSKADEKPRTAAPSVPPPPAPALPSAPPPKRSKTVPITWEEMLEVVRRTGDPILAAELAKRRPPSPSPGMPGPDMIGSQRRQNPSRHHPGARPDESGAVP
jgi:DNA-binding Lrp family transcriptional regulator